MDQHQQNLVNENIYLRRDSEGWRNNVGWGLTCILPLIAPNRPVQIEAKCFMTAENSLKMAQSHIIS